MAKILKMPIDITDRAAATTAPQDVLAEDAATFDVLRRMREDILCCVLKPDQRLRFGELRQRYGTSVGTLREALSHLVSEGLARTEAGRPGRRQARMGQAAQALPRFAGGDLHFAVVAALP